jgi:hypothetical protein
MTFYGTLTCTDVRGQRSARAGARSGPARVSHCREESGGFRKEWEAAIRQA